MSFSKNRYTTGIDDVKFWTESEYFSLVLAIISFPLLLIIWPVEGILVSLFSLFELLQIIIGDAIAQIENNPSVAIKIKNLPIKRKFFKAIAQIK